MLVALVGALVTAGCVGGGERATLERVWTSETGTGVEANHHAVAAGQVANASMVYAPVGASGNKSGCALYGLHGENGTVRWRYGLPPTNCTIHAVGDPALADSDGDGETELLATTTDRMFLAFDPRTGEIETTFRMAAYGYTQPVVADLRGDDTPETVVVDAHGTLSVLGPNGTTRWTHAMRSDVFADVGVADFDADGTPEIAVGTDAGRVVLLGPDGAIEWNRSVGKTVTWTATGQLDGDGPVEFVAATTAGEVVALDGTGSREWSRSLGTYAAVATIADADGDGDPEVYATAKDGKLRALDGATGDVEWTTALPGGEAQMTPPPTVGDLDGDGTLELVAVTNGGTVAVVSPGGKILATAGRDMRVWIDPAVADVTAGPGAEILVNYGDGRVAAFTYRAE